MDLQTLIDRIINVMRAEQKQDKLDNQSVRRAFTSVTDYVSLEKLQTLCRDAGEQFVSDDRETVLEDLFDLTSEALRFAVDILMLQEQMGNTGIIFIY